MSILGVGTGLACKFLTFCQHADQHTVHSGISALDRNISLPPTLSRSPSYVYRGEHFLPDTEFSSSHSSSQELSIGSEISRSALHGTSLERSGSFSCRRSALSLRTQCELSTARSRDKIGLLSDLKAGNIFSALFGYCSGWYRRHRAGAIPLPGGAN